tara:strand:+ start:195 stop:485 length:291 start_codon:yes stop_codon:yes gene_type:complete
MSESELRLPSEKVLKHVAKLSIEQDKPIMMDYWEDSYGDASVLIGVRSNDDKMLVRSPEEYTSPISKIFKVAEEFIIITENSIYVVSAEIPTKRIS